MKTKVISFIQGYVNVLHNNRIRFGFSSYDTLADTPLELSDYESVDQIRSLVDDIDPESEGKRTSSGLMEVRLKQNFNSESKKLILVITNGFSKGMFSDPTPVCSLTVKIFLNIYFFQFFFVIIGV